MEDKGVGFVALALILGIAILLGIFIYKPEFGGLALLIAGGLITFALGLISLRAGGWGILVGLAILAVSGVLWWRAFVVVQDALKDIGLL